MMKKIAFFMSFLFLVPCKATPYNDNKPSTNAIAATANQHVAMGVLLALHYCEYNDWPSTLTKLQEFTPKRNFKLPVEINWNWFSRPSVEITFSEKIVVRTNDGIQKKHSTVITSFHKAPGCDGNNIKVNASLNIGS